MWWGLSALAVVAVFLFWRGPNAVGGALAIGLVAGVIAALVYLFRGNGFQWAIVGKWVVVCILVGTVVEIGSRLSRRGCS